MKIALITSMKAGLHHFVFRDIDALSKKGHTVRLFTLLNNEGLYNPKPEWEVVPASVKKIAFTLIPFMLSRPLLFIQLLFKAIQTQTLQNMLIAIAYAKHLEDINVIYAYFGDHKFFVGYYLKWITNTPLLVTIRAYELYDNPNPKFFIEALDYCDRIVTITEHNKAYLCEHFGAAEEKIDIVRQIVDMNLYKHVEKIRILIVGFFSTKKGHEVLFNAIKQMNRSDVELWVVGDGAKDRALVDCRQIVKELDIEDQVVFFGAHSGNALRTFYSLCHIFCLPSRTDRSGDREGFPNVIAEAMAFGKPVVSTYHAGIPEVIDQILVEEDNVPQLVDALNRVCDSLALREQMGRRNRTVVEQMFSIANNDRLEEILESYARKTNALDTEQNQNQNQQVLTRTTL